MPGIYIHIPFCKQACHYCNFHFSTSLRYKNEFLSALLKEIERVEDIVQPVQTIYFGGGTPSLLETEELSTIMTALKSRFGWQPDAEITLEANPDDITAPKLNNWKELGINRLSIGVQSFFEEDLRWMNRAHNATQAIHSLEMAVKEFSNITLDLIYGSPGLTDEKWKQNLDTAIGLGITHLSCYALTVEPKTPLDKRIRQQQSPDIDSAQQSRQFLYLMEYMAQNGFEHYEISNFAKPGHRSRHNSSYWKGENYIGLGPGAHSYDGQSRWWNVANNNQYIREITEGKLPQEKENLTLSQRWNEYIMIHLRTMEGINFNELTTLFSNEKEVFENKWIDHLLRETAPHIKAGHLVQDDHRIYLTNEGKLFADGIAGDLFQ
ncbi:MAG: radical SAM family heme chaperone HemW [Chitinophagaceae bacterium]|nr:radical SAM family heme chaperone HemW [Chitinophagaceae bacterium]